MKQSQIITGVSVIVHNDNFEKALRQFKKRVQKSGRLDAAKAKEHYVKPTEQRRLKKKASLRKAMQPADVRKY